MFTNYVKIRRHLNKVTKFTMTLSQSTALYNHFNWSNVSQYDCTDTSNHKCSYICSQGRRRRLLVPDE